MTAVSNSDLLSWLKLFWTNDGALTYDSISDAFFINEVFREIDSNAISNEQLSSNDSMMDKVKNWEILIKNIRIYYAEVLQQAIVVRLPSIVAICRQQNSQKFQSEIDKTIFLILGAAVQCEKKDYFIQDILNRLPDESIQHGLMNFIKQITESIEMVISYINLASFSTTDLVFHLRNILEQRDDNFLEENKILLTEIDELQRHVKDQKNQIQVLRNVGLDSGTVNLQSNKGIAVELAEYKAKLRKIQNELDEKNDLLSDCRNEFDIIQDENNKLKEEQMKFKNESRRARQLQDELDSYKESVIRLPVIEAENAKLKEKVNELEYYRARCEELREDLAIISNENTNLLDKIDNNTKQVEQALKFESECRKSNRKIAELEKIRSEQNMEIAKLESDLRSLQEKNMLHLSSNSELSNKLNQLQKDTNDNGTISSISDQVIDKTNARVLRLEIENRALRDKLSEDNKIEIAKFQEKIATLEGENARVMSKVSRLQEANKLEIQKLMEVEESKQLAIREKNQLELTLKSSKESDGNRIKELTKENESLSETILIIRERSEKSNDLRLNELEKENSKLHTALNEFNHKVSNLEFDLQRSVQKCNRLDQSLEKSQQDYLLLSKQNGDLNKEITSLKLYKTRLEELQDKFSILEVEKLRLEALTSEYSQQLKQNAIVTNDQSDEDMKQLATENQRKTSQLLTKISELESELLKIRTEKDKCDRQSSSVEKKNKALQQEIETYKVELANSSRLESKLKLAEKNLEELEKEREQLQTQNLKLDQDIKKIDKENRRLKNHSDVQNTSVTNYKTRITELEKKLYLLELKQVEKDDVDLLKTSLEESEKRIADSEKKNRELLLQTKEEKRQCTTLREELLNERLETQNLRNQLQKMADEFEKLGVSEEEAHAEKFKQLESRVNTTVDDAFKKKEERNALLQSKLKSFNIREKELTDKLFDINGKYQALQQKYEEELNLRLLRNNSIQNSKEVPAYAQYLLELKDEIVKLERNNAQIGSEKQFLNGQCQDLQEKLSKLENKYSIDLEKLQKRFDDVNSDKMKLHIEESTLKSQLETLRNDNKNLANQIATNERNLMTSADERNATTTMIRQLESQNNSLQKLNDQLSQEYDNVKRQLDRQAAQIKSLRSELQTKSDQLEKTKKSYDSIKHLQDSLENEKNNLADGARQLINLRLENSTINEEYHVLIQKCYKMETDMKAVTQENKLLKSEHSQEKSIASKMMEDNSNMEREINELEKEIVKLEGRIESLGEQNEQLKKENTNLLHQMKSMLMQNQELLTETLQHKQNHHTEETTLRDRLSQLQRHKERLEEKIMEQYKTIPSTKKPKGARNKFFKKAKEMLKRRDSRTLADQDRKSSEEMLNHNQRSRSCVTILGDEPYSIKTGDRSSDYRNEDSETSDRYIAESDSDASELDFSGPIPKLKASRQSDIDTNSMLSSVSQRVHSYKSEPHRKLIPGSMSMYDRDESEKNRTSELNAFFLELHNKKLAQDKKEKELRNNESIPDTNGATPVDKHVVNVKNIVRAQQRPQSVMDSAIQQRRQLPHQSVSLTTGSSGPAGALTFGNISSKQINTHSPQEASPSNRDNTITVLPSKQTVNQCQPGVPARKTSLPVTDRVEEEFSDTDNMCDMTFYKPNDDSRRQLNPIRPQSTVPASASSKEILQRLQKNAGRNTPVSNDLRTRTRSQPPSALVKQIANNNSNGQTKPDSIKVKPQTITPGATTTPINKVNIRKSPPIPLRHESSHRAASSKIEKPEQCPTPPVRRESGQPKPPVDNNSSSISDNSERSKPKVFYQYGHL